MSYLIDMNVVSEFVKPRPSPIVIGWLRSTPKTELHLSALTLGEIRYGIERLPVGSRRERLRIWLERDVPARFSDRVLAVTDGVADRWGRLRKDLPKTVAVVDSLIAATALHHDLRLVTRNVKDFARFPGLIVFNPWEQ